MKFKKQKAEDLLAKEIQNEVRSMDPTPNPQPNPEINPFLQDQVMMDQMRKVLPESDLELTYAFTNPQWGDESVNKELQDKFKRNVFEYAPKGSILQDNEGNQIVSDGKQKILNKKDYWANLAFLTRDLRLANYDRTTYNFCSYMYELAGAFLNEGYVEAAALSMQIGAIHGEMSQGRGGFLRKMQNTLIKEEKFQQMEVKKNSILSGRPKDQYQQ